MLKARITPIFLTVCLAMSSFPHFARAGEVGQINVAALGQLILTLRFLQITPNLLEFYRSGPSTSQATAAAGNPQEDSESFVPYISLLRGLSEEDVSELTLNLFHDSNLEPDSENLDALESSETPIEAPAATAAAGTPPSIQHGIQFFDMDGVFIPPANVRHVQVIAIGGGAGGGTGGSSHRGGGGSGYLLVKNIELKNGEPVRIIIGDGGAGGMSLENRSGAAGGDTHFGDYLQASGGKPSSGKPMIFGGDGGSGGGAGGGSSHSLTGGNGGTQGLNGGSIQTWAGGIGASWNEFARLNPEIAKAGQGGQGGQASTSGHPGGGGGGGLIVIGQRTPQGGDAQETNTKNFGRGGEGYGAGGGGGGYDPKITYGRGGPGAAGALLVRW